MTTTISRQSAPRQSRHRGSAAVEAAILLPIFVTFLTFPIFYARCYWHYTAAQKAAQDAARYLSGVPAREMRSKTLAQAAAATAATIARREIAELSPGTTIAPPTVYCDDVLCGTYEGTVPSTVHIVINFGMRDTLFRLVDTGRYGLQITADVKMRYVGT